MRSASTAEATSRCGVAARCGSSKVEVPVFLIALELFGFGEMTLKPITIPVP
jgi:hypothetical protein